MPKRELLIIDEEDYKKQICNHCMLKGEGLCIYGELTCPTLKGLIDISKTLTDEEVNCLQCYCLSTDWCSFVDNRNKNWCDYQIEEIITKLKLEKTTKD
jgi:hypothetical protein